LKGPPSQAVPTQGFFSPPSALVTRIPSGRSHTQSPPFPCHWKPEMWGRSRVPAMLDLDAYLARIGLHGRPSVAEVHRAHVTSIPFENLDPYCGIPVSLAVEDLERKLVSRRRGGYCFEQNL